MREDELLRAYGVATPAPTDLEADKLNAPANPFDEPDDFLTHEEAERFWARVKEVYDGCMTWALATDVRGNGIFHTGYEKLRPRTVAYRLSRGPVPEGCVLEATCQTPGCLAPAHMAVVGRAEAMRGLHRRREAARPGL